MAVDEAARHQLYNSLESTLGPEPTSTLMSLLPPVGWADVATKQDLATLQTSLEHAFEARVQQQVNALTFRLLAGVFALNSITWAALTFSG